MLLELVAGSLAGVVIGAATSLIPGLGPMASAVAAGVISVINPIAGAAAQIGAYVVSNCLGSAKEALDSSSSGNPEMIATADDETVIDPVRQCRSLYWGKVIGSVLGLVAGLFLGGSIIPFTGIPSLTPWLVGLVLLMLWVSFKRQWLLMLAIFLGSQVLFANAAAWGINNVVYALGAALFAIPACIEAIGKGKKANGAEDCEGISTRIDMPDPVKGVLASLMAIAAPGVSPSLLIVASSRKGNSLLQITMGACEMLVTTFGLVGLLAGTVSSKSGLLVELTALPVVAGVWMVVIFGVCLALSAYLLPKFYRAYRGLVNVPGMHLLALVLSVVTLITSAGPVMGVVLIVAGLVINAVLKATGGSKAMLALIWTAPILRL